MSASAFMSVFGALGGGALRLAPLAIDAWQKRRSTTNEVELARIALEKSQAERDSTLALAQAHTSLSETQAQVASQIARTQAELAAQQTALVEMHAKAQSSGVGWVDALNVLVRPAITMWLLLLYTTYKVELLAIGAIQHTPFTELVSHIWTDDDIAIFAGTVTFWFVDQTLSPSARPPTPPHQPKG
jgi:hypothetical protein